MALSPGPVGFAPSGRGYVAYRTVGDAGAERPDLVLLYSLTASFESLWELPSAVTVLERLAEHCRVVLVDRRGTGPSDPLGPEEVPTPEAHAEDVAAVLRAIDAHAAVVVGESYMGGPAALALGALHPELVARVVTIASPPRGATVTVDAASTIDRVLWGTHTDQEEVGPDLMPSVSHDAGFQAWAERAGRATSPGVAARFWQQMLSFDLTELLPRVQRPVTIISTGHWTADPDAVAELAALLPDVEVVEIERPDTLMFVGETDELVDELLLLATGSRHRGRARRRLLAVLFSDLEGSTEKASELGDVAWRAALDAHDRIVAEIVRDHDGTTVKSTGDGVLVTFALPSSAVAAAQRLVARLGEVGLPARAGVHVGEVEVRGADIGGVAVHLAARVAALAAAHGVLVSEAVVATTLGAGFSYGPLTEQVLRGVPGRWRIAEVR